MDQIENTRRHPPMAALVTRLRPCNQANWTSLAPISTIPGQGR